MEIENGVWKYNEIKPKPWEKNEWGWVMTMSIGYKRGAICYYVINF